MNQVVGGWRLGAIQQYSSGTPIGVTRNSTLPISSGTNRAYITTYDGWSAAAFPTQPAGLLGNSTRYNPKLRSFPNLNENVSLGKAFPVTEHLRLDFRAEAFNIFNRTVFASPKANLNSNAFGLVNGQANSPRQMQLALKLYW